eukprot:Skav217030  [mRNA]  locus=scaffold1803:367294:367542:+ [translate_table: standard]
MAAVATKDIVTGSGPLSFQLFDHICNSAFRQLGLTHADRLSEMMSGLEDRWCPEDAGSLRFEPIGPLLLANLNANMEDATKL